MTIQWRRGGQRVSLKKFQRKLPGQTGLAELVAANCKATPQAIRANKPLESVGLAVHKDQVAEFNEFYRENGVNGVHHKANGACVIESRAARNKVLALRGLRDNDACYGDCAGKN